VAKYESIWTSLEDEEYRHEFSSDVGTGLSFQIRALREKKGWTQEELAARTGKKQETISQWENPDYGSYTLNSLKSLASAFDVALIVKYAPFSELVDWTVNLSPSRLAPLSFEEERATVALATVSTAQVPTVTTVVSVGIDPFQQYVVSSGWTGMTTAVMTGFSPSGTTLG
jgi:transcriptional regulator with XRE-family HTH domain